MTKVLILGGGIAGCQTALRLAKEGYEIVIVEEKSDILLGTSGNTPGRMGLGYHYFDKDTAIRYMKQTVEFMKTYEDCFIGNKDETPYLLNGRYFVMKDSLKGYQDLMAGYDAVSREFETMCDQDSSNKKIFDTTHLHKTLHVGEYKDDVNIENIAYAIETKERLLDWQLFSNKLKEKISSYPNISIKRSTKVQKVLLASKAGSLSAILDNGEYGKEEKADYVVNCTWQVIEEVNSKSGIGDYHFKKNSSNSSDLITSRLKLLAEVRLPDSLREKPSMFFCVGPHAMFSNLDNGIARITYANETNHSTTTSDQLPFEMKRFLYNDRPSESLNKFLNKNTSNISREFSAFLSSSNVVASNIKDLINSSQRLPEDITRLIITYEKLTSDQKNALLDGKDIANEIKDFLAKNQRLSSDYKSFLKIYSKLPEEIRLALSGGILQSEVEDFGKKIIDGVAKYIPEMAKSKIIKVIPGIVKSRGSFNLNDKDSDFHQRNYSGVVENCIGHIDNAAMKLFYCLGNAEEVYNLIKEQEVAKIQIKSILEFTGYNGQWEDVEDKSKLIKGQALQNHLSRNFTSTDYDSEKIDNFKIKFKESFDVKESVTKSIKEHDRFKKTSGKRCGQSSDSEQDMEGKSKKAKSSQPSPVLDPANTLSELLAETTGREGGNSPENKTPTRPFGAMQLDKTAYLNLSRE